MKNPKANADISIDFQTPSDAEAIVQALIPETRTKTTYRAQVEVTRRGRTARMTFRAEDLIALRATVNSYLRIAASWRRVSDTLRLDQRPK